MRNLVFLNHDDVRNGGSTVARSEQMAELSLRMFGPKKWNISYTSDACIRNAIVIVHKGFLERTSLGQLEAMKSANNILIADYIDIKPIHAQMRFFDAFLASSHAQAAWLKTNFPHIPTFHVTQRVDPRLPALTVQMETFRAAYFGARRDPAAPFNMKFQTELAQEVDIIPTPTDNIAWMDKLATYNCHYAVRASQPWDGFKPLGKAFIAARYGCPIIISTVDQDAEFYLGADYPYLLRSDNLNDVTATLAQARDDFRGPRWTLALEILKDIKNKTTDSFLMNEFKAAIDYFSTPA
jgi:hypothetical protein